MLRSSILSDPSEARGQSPNPAIARCSLTAPKLAELRRLPADPFRLRLRNMEPAVSSAWDPDDFKYWLPPRMARNIGRRVERQAHTMPTHGSMSDQISISTWMSEKAQLSPFGLLILGSS